MKCYSCGNEMRETIGSVNAGWGKYDLTINGVKVFLCDECGEKVFDPNEVHMIQEISRAYHDSPDSRPEILNVEEVAEYLRVTPQTVYKLIKSGKLNAIKVGREWRFSRQSIESFFPHDKVAIAARSVLSQGIPEDDRKIIERHLKEMGIVPQGGNQ